MATVQHTDDARDDLRTMGGSVRKMVLKETRRQPRPTWPAIGNNTRGNRTGLRKLVIGDREYGAVYRAEADGQVAVVIVVAKRADHEVYELAIERLKLSDNLDVKSMADGLKMLME